MEELATLAASAATIEAPPNTERSLSNVGIIDQYVKPCYGGRIEIMDFWFGMKVLARQLNMFLWTRQGKLNNVSACYNENFYVMDFVREFLQCIKRNLIEGLDLYDG